ncbi:hypothetical protein JB92DRAFT_3165948 [Gautieria morchelliformis]|nr:hypothetical protein JB92DRAFT_3165948 [Gautieria morchelliformis]
MSPLIIDTRRSALAIIDMQSMFFCAVYRWTINLTAVHRLLPAPRHTFRANGMKVLWTNWGLDEFDLRIMPLAFSVGLATLQRMGVINGTDWGC